MRVVAADLDDLAPVAPAGLHFEAAVQAAEDAGGLLPRGVAGGLRHGVLTTRWVIDALEAGVTTGHRHARFKK